VAAVEVNLKLLALKQLVEINLEQHQRIPGAELQQVLRLIDELL
jgi:hypothetical protein